MENNEIYVIGIGHNSIVTIDLAELSGFKVIGLIHYNKELTGQFRWGYPIISDTESFLKKDIKKLNFALSMGENKIRKELYVKIKNKGGIIPQLIHPTSSVSKFSELEEGVQIHANATIQADVIIKENSIISYGSGLTHNVIVNAHCYIAGHSIIGAYTKIEELVFIGMGTTTVSGKVPFIGNNSLIGAGSLVTREVKPHSIIYGRPAK